MITTRPATAADIAVVHPDMSCSYRAWACEDDGKLMGVIGIALTRPVANLFCWFDEDLRPVLTCPTLMRSVVRVRRAMDEMRMPIAAVRDPRERRAPKILKKLGFRFAHIDADGDAIYIRQGGAR